MLTGETYALASLALVAGVVSFTAPCTLPLLPGYVSFVSGMSSAVPSEVSRRKVWSGSLLFVAGFTSVFVALGMSASRLGLLLAQNADVLRYVSGGLIIVMGLITAGVLRVPLLQRQVRFDLARLGTGPRAAFPLGAAFAFGWTPCIGPVLAGVLATAATTSTMAQGAVLLTAYSLGLGVPFVALAVAVSRGRTRLAWLRRHGRRIEIAGGLVLVLMGIAVLLGAWTSAMSWMLSWYARIGWPPI